LCDDPDNIKDVFSPDLIRKVDIKSENGEMVSGIVNVSQATIDIITQAMGEGKDEFKLLVCNTESSLGKEFKEQFDITGNYYRFAYVNDKRSSVGKEKVSKESVEERISIN
jgi:hypothetical protein